MTKKIFFSILGLGKLTETRLPTIFKNELKNCYV